jgi:hypothetical protein
VPGRAGAVSACFAVTCFGAAERHRRNARYDSRDAEAAFTALGGAPYRSRMLGFDTGDVRVLDLHETGGCESRSGDFVNGLLKWRVRRKRPPVDRCARQDVCDPPDR